MTSIWIRAEQRSNEQRVGVTPDVVDSLISAGFNVIIERDQTRAIPIQQFKNIKVVDAGTWQNAPNDTIIFGLKELPNDNTPLKHRHIMFGHAYKGQPDGQKLLSRFAAGGGTLYDLEYLTDEKGKRVAAFGYWAGFVGAAVAIKSWSSIQLGKKCASMHPFQNARSLEKDISSNLSTARPSVIIVGANGRVGSGAIDFCKKLNVTTTQWDIAETAHGGPYPEIYEHDIFLNCVLADKATPVFIPKSTINAKRKLTVIGDIACDPTNFYSPIKVYNSETTWEQPTLRICDDPVLDVTAIDNLPSILPQESSEDFASQLLPSLLSLGNIEAGVWKKAKLVFDQKINELV